MTLTYHHDDLVIVGRDQERGQLHALLDRATGGQGALVLVSGEAGIGKTTLMVEAARYASDHGCLVIRGGCYDLTSTPPYGPWIEALFRSYRPGGDLPEIPEAMRDEEGLRQLGSQAALFSEVDRFIADIAAQVPLLIILEDLHWTDQASVDLLRFLSRQLTDRRVLVVTTYRDDEIDRGHPLYTQLPTLTRESRAERIALKRLEREDLVRLVAQSYCLESTAADRLALYLIERSEGNPFYVIEILRELEERRVFNDAGDQWLLEQPFPAHMPALLQQTLDAKLDRLGHDDLERLSIAAVIGQNVAYDLWQRVGDACDNELGSTIEVAARSNILIEDGSRTGYRFTHALIQEALYTRLIIPRRRAIHQEVAETLEREPLPDPDQVARHYVAAGDERAAEWLIRAGERAQRQYAWVVAADKYEQAIPLLPQDRESARLTGWLQYLVGWLYRVFDHDRSLASLTHARNTGAKIDDALLVACSLGSMGLLHCFKGDLTHGIDMMEEGVDQLEVLTTGDRNVAIESPPYSLNADDPAVQFIGEGNFSGWLTAVGRIRESIERGEAFVERYDRAVQSRIPRVAEIGIDQPPFVPLINAYGLAGTPERARYWAKRAKEYHRSTAHHLMVLAALLVELERVILPYRTDRISEREQWSREAAETFRLGAGSLGERISGEYVSDKVSLIEGDWETAARVADWFARFAVEMGIRQSALCTLGWLALYRGNYEEAWRQVQRALPDGLSAEPGSIQYTGTLGVLDLAASVALGEGRYELAHEWIELHYRWLAWGEAMFSRSAADLNMAQYWLAKGEAGRSIAFAQHALGHATDPRQPLALLAAHRFLGHLDTLDNQIDDAQEHLTAALELADACNAPFERALTLVELARLRIAEGNQEAANATLDEAYAICEPLEAQPTLDLINELRAEAREVPVSNSPAHGLTPREVEVLQLVAEGLTDPQVAERLFLSPRTVSSHLTSIYTKLGVSSRAAATRVAVEQGIL